MLDNASKKIENLEERNFELTKNINEAVKTVKQTESEKALLANYVSALKTRTYIYFPTIDDAVDIKLAEHLNNLSDPQGLSSLFKRESSGIYHFGTKKIFVKIENGKIVSMLF